MDFATINELTATSQWMTAIKEVRDMGMVTRPRGHPTRDMAHATTRIDMEYPIVCVPKRELGLRFLAAEPHWILSGDNRLRSIACYAENMVNFSDDGHFLRGAYGPKIVDQLPWTVEKLLEDNDTRQSVLTIWRERPGPSKDIPCTVAMQFRLRGNDMFTSVFMRSSDLWLGWPYDIFTFTCVSQAVALMIKDLTKKAGKEFYPTLRTLSVTAGSLHLYETDVGKANAVLGENRGAEANVDWRQHVDLGHLMYDLEQTAKGEYRAGPIGSAVNYIREFYK